MKTFAKFPLEVPIGDSIYFNDQTLVCKPVTEEKACNACYLDGVSLCRWMGCSADRRTDKAEVYFEKVRKHEQPQKQGLYQANKAAKVGDDIECQSCHTTFRKSQYSQAFCCVKCKDAFHNKHNPDRHKH